MLQRNIRIRSPLLQERVFYSYPDGLEVTDQRVRGDRSSSGPVSGVAGFAVRPPADGSAELYGKALRSHRVKSDR
jgi:hypothetical protein